MNDKTVASKVETKKSKRNLRCAFGDEEILRFGKELADKTTALRVLEEDKKRCVADFGAKISAMEAEISLLTSKIQSGYEYRMVSCTEHLATPGPDKKRIVRDDTGAEIGVEEMTASEMQVELIKEETVAEA